MISGEVLRDARELARLTQQELANRLDVALRTVVYWEAKGVPPKRTSRVERALGQALRQAEYDAWTRSTAGRLALNDEAERYYDAQQREADPIGWGLERASDRDLIAELLRRLEARHLVTTTSPPKDTPPTSAVIDVAFTSPEEHAPNDVYEGMPAAADDAPDFEGEDEAQQHQP